MKLATIPFPFAGGAAGAAAGAAGAAGATGAGRRLNTAGCPFPFRLAETETARHTKTR